MKAAFLYSLLLCATLLSPTPSLARATGTVSLQCVNCELTGVLRKMAQRLGKNIYIGPGVSGTVTADFKDVSAEWALGLVLHMQTTEYRYKIVGNTIIVATPAKLAQIPDDIFLKH